MPLSATSIGGKAFVDIGPSDNVAWDQPRVTVQLIVEESNDDFPNRFDLGDASSVTTTGSNIGFTAEAGEPVWNGLTHSAWWTWTAPASGTLAVDTFGSRYDTHLALATGSAIDALTVLAQDDDTAGEQSQITAAVTSGTQYQIAVDGSGALTGAITLSLQLTPDAGGATPDVTDPLQNTIVGPSIFNTWLLDTGANTTLAFQTAVDEMGEFDPKYETDGLFEEIGVGGSQVFDVSIPYRFDFAGITTYERNSLQNASIISNPNTDVSIFGPWGIVGMPAMTERVTTLDFTPWTTLMDFDLFMLTDFADAVPDPIGPRYTVSVDNRVSFSPGGKRRRG